MITLEDIGLISEAKKHIRVQAEFAEERRDRIVYSITMETKQALALIKLLDMIVFGPVTIPGEIKKS